MGSSQEYPALRRAAQRCAGDAGVAAVTEVTLKQETVFSGGEMSSRSCCAAK